MKSSSTAFFLSLVDFLNSIGSWSARVSFFGTTSYMEGSQILSWSIVSWTKSEIRHWSILVTPIRISTYSSSKKSPLDLSKYSIK